MQLKIFHVHVSHLYIILMKRSTQNFYLFLIWIVFLFIDEL